MAAMDIHDERDDLTDDDEVTAHRARAKAELAQIAQRARQALAKHGIDLDLFFMIPSSGDSILTFGTITDPPDEQWSRVSEVVSSIVGQSVGLTHTRCREIACASTTDAIPASQEGATR
jgi:L-aminopeptidase/D-esterase-like protein